MPVLPTFLTEQTEEAILARMKERIASDLDKSEGSYVHDALAPAAIEFARTAIDIQEMLRRGFAAETFGSYLDLRAEEHGVYRRAATESTGQVQLTGSAGVTVPAGTRVATAADPATNALSVEFLTTEAVTLAPTESGTGAGVAKVKAVEAGSAGNVPSSAISLLVVPLSGVTGVTNLSATIGGIDTEDDDAFRARFLQAVRTRGASGNKADYENWALEVPGVGAVSVVPVKDGPGTVSIAVVDEEKNPAGQSLVDSVQTYIAPPWDYTTQAETMTISGYGVTTDSTQVDATSSCIKMTFSASGQGLLKHTSLCSVLRDDRSNPEIGIWQARFRVKASRIDGSANLLQLEVYNVSGGYTCKATPTGTGVALLSLKGTDLSQEFAEKTVQFYWNGQDVLELRCTRLTSDTVTTVWVDSVRYRSTFSKDTGDGKSPIGARVTVEPATAQKINISVKLTTMAGYDPAAVKAAVCESWKAYFQTLVFVPDQGAASTNDVQYARVGLAILDTPGVYDYANLTINSGTNNILIGLQELAQLGEVTWLA